MILDQAACEWMKLALVTEPVTVPTDWEASIDGGTTWVTATAIDASSAWLTAGPNYAGPEAPDFTITTTPSTTRVKVRLVEAPETVIRSATRISVKDL